MDNKSILFYKDDFYAFFKLFLYQNGCRFILYFGFGYLTFTMVPCDFHLWKLKKYWILIKYMGLNWLYKIISNKVQMVSTGQRIELKSEQVKH